MKSRKTVQNMILAEVSTPEMIYELRVSSLGLHSFLEYSVDVIAVSLVYYRIGKN